MNSTKTLVSTASAAVVLLFLSGCQQPDVASLVEQAQSGRGVDLNGQNYQQYLDQVGNQGDAASGAGQTGSHDTGAGCAITEAQQKMLDEINKARAAGQDCGDEVFPPAPPLTWNCKLEQAAWAHTDDMVRNNFFSHTGSDGLDAGNRLDAAGYNWKVYGENLAAGFLTEEETIKGLLKSPGHCHNIMNPKFREFGSARVFTEGNDFISYWTHEFGTAF